MLDPFVDGRSGAGWPLGGDPPPAGNVAPNPPVPLKAPPPATLDQRWTTWAAGFGAGETAKGDPVVIGSTNVTATDYGYAGGMDYHISPNSAAGFALAGGGTNWGLAQNLGGGHSDDFHAGAYGVSRAGPLYFAGAVAFAEHWLATSRTALGQQLTASFDAQSYGVRVEGGYRYQTVLGRVPFAITPYAALRVETFDAPAYSETDANGGGFGLRYGASNTTDTRSELGTRFDSPAFIGAMPLVLRGQLAWAHDWVSNPSLSAVFEALPGSNFVVYGAPLPKDSALTTAEAVLHITPNWSFAAKFDGEFASGSQIYGGTGTLRYTW
jgi:outer membrane autotransporter protein